MWRDSQNKKKAKSGKVNNSRWLLIVVIIFLFMGSLIYKLYGIQIRKSDFYVALASAQHQIFSQLSPERGKIYFSEKNSSNNKLYPVVTNKEFAEVYVVPKDIENPQEIAEKLYSFLDEAKLKEEMKKNNPDLSDFTIASSTKEAIIKNYLKKLDKPGDPYEPLLSKVSLDDLLKLFAYISKPLPEDDAKEGTVDADELMVKLNKIVYRSDNQTFTLPGFGFTLQKYRYYPENEIASHITGFTNQIDGELQGRYGLEEFFNIELYGKAGSLKTDVANKSSLMIINDREYVKPEPGSDLVLTIDRNVEFAVCEKLQAEVDRHKAEGGSVIVMDPKTGAIIAMCSVPSFDPNNYQAVKDISVYNNPAILYQYEPGSVFKTVTLAIAIDQGKISPTTTYEDTGQVMIKGWHKPISNSDFYTHGPHGVVDMSSVLDNSLNTGAIFAMNQVGPKVFADYVKKFGFGEKTGIELGAESSGNINNLLSSRVKEIDAATASFGQGIATTPLQMIMPYQAIANHGLMMKPYVVKTIISHDGEEQNILPKSVAQVISEKTAATVSAMLVNVVEKGHSQKAAIDGYYVGGKTGTAQIASVGGYSKDAYIHTFVGIAPIENPAFVMLTKIDKPQGVKYAEGSALPLWRDIAEFILNYYAVPKTR